MTWNMFQSLGLTTNNHAEAYNSRLGKSTKLGKHPNFYIWAESIISELKNSSVDAAMANAGNPNVRPKGTKAIKSQQRREKLHLASKLVKLLRLVPSPIPDSMWACQLL